MKTLYMFFIALIACQSILFSQEKWEPVDGPTAIRIGHLYYDEKNLELFDFTPWLDIHKTSDLGTTWTTLALPSDRPVTGAGQAIYTDMLFSANNLVYAVCTYQISEYNKDDTYYSYLYKSTDRGETWVKTNDVNYSILEAAIDSKGNIYAVSILSKEERGVLISQDEGQTFNLVTKSIDEGIISTDGLIIGRNDMVYILTRDTNNHSFAKDIYSSSDLGKSWQKLLLPESIKKPYYMIMGDTNTVYIVSYENSLRTLTFSSDGGKTWAEPYQADQNMYFQGLTKNVYRNQLYSKMLDTIFRSTDYGQTWNEFKINNSYNYEAIYQFNDSLIFAYSKDKALLRSTDNGQSWTDVNTSHNKLIYAQDLYARNNEVLYAGESGTSYSSDNGSSWTKINEPHPTKPSYCYISNDGTLYLFWGSYSSSSCYSTDKGKTWNHDCAHIRPYWNNRCITEKSNGEIFIMTEGHLLIGQKNNWKSYDLRGVVTDSTISSSTALASSSSGNVYLLGAKGLFRYNPSKDYPDILVPKADLPFAYNPYSFFMAADSQDNLFISNEREAYVSNDLGKTWTGFFYSEKSNYANRIIINSKDEIYLWLRYDIKISRDGGKTWTSCIEGLPENAHIISFSISDNGYAYCGFSHDRIYRRNVFPTSVEEAISAGLTESFAFPNPARDIVSLSLSAEFSAQPVSVEVYDISGQIVYRLDKISAPDRSRIQLDVSTLECGLYYAIIKAGTSSRFEKFSIIK